MYIFLSFRWPRTPTWHANNCLQISFAANNIMPMRNWTHAQVWPRNPRTLGSRSLRRIIDQLATNRSRYFSQPRPIINMFWARLKLTLARAVKRGLTWALRRAQWLFQFDWLFITSFDSIIITLQWFIEAGYNPFQPGKFSSLACKYKKQCPTKW